MKLQVALDVVTLDEARAVLADVAPHVDIAEIGLLFYSHGYDALDALRAEYPDLEFLADVKISDGGNFCVKQAHQHGAHYVTVLGVVDDETIKGAVAAHEETGIQVVIDMVGCKNFYERVLELDQMGVQYINIHTPFDLQVKGVGPFDQLAIARSLVKQAKLSVAGGINPDTIGRALDLGADIVVAGGTLLDPASRAENARRMRETIENRSSRHA